MNQLTKKILASFIAAILIMLGIHFVFEDLEAVQLALPVALICILIFAICEEEY